MSNTLIDVGPLTVPLTKHLQCGHDRTDHAPAKPGESMHCHTCRALADVVDVTFPRSAAVTNFDRDRLKAAGYTPREIKRMELRR